MSRTLAVLVVGAAFAAFAQAHAPYILVDGAATSVVFSDELAPDMRIKEATWKKLEGLKLTSVSATGKMTEVPLKLVGSALTANTPADAVLLSGAIDYGISTQGDKPKYIKFYLKAIVGNIPANGGKLDDKTGLDVVPVVEAGKVRFAVYQLGKPVAKAAVEVIVPEKKEKESVVTDDKGLTTAFEARGRYGVTVRVSDGMAGEFQGTKFTETTHTATLVVTVK